jgi:hypothetical protein
MTTSSLKSLTLRRIGWQRLLKSDIMMSNFYRGGAGIQNRSGAEQSASRSTLTGD